MKMNGGALVTKDLVEKYLRITQEARNKATPLAKGEGEIRQLQSMLEMCDNYYSDAKHFMEADGDFVEVIVGGEKPAVIQFYLPV